MRIPPTSVRNMVRKSFGIAMIASLFLAVPSFAQRAAVNDPAEPPQGKAQPKLLPRPAGAIPRPSVDQNRCRL